jgi:cyclophilin family peptidyl-prolyl cis-trans isomerase
VKTLLPPILASFALILLVACGGGNGDDADTSNANETNATCGPAGSRIAAIARDNQRQFASRPERVIDPAKSYIATMVTSKGRIVMQLAAADAPNTVNNFVFLSCHGFYDGITFHRVVKEPTPFVIQGGDPRGDGTGGPGYTFDNEISPNLKHDAAGILSMARSAQPNTNGSQFFITLAPAAHLDGGYNAFGRVTQGMEAVNAIVPGDRILSVSIEER